MRREVSRGRVKLENLPKQIVIGLTISHMSGFDVTLLGVRVVYMW